MPKILIDTETNNVKTAREIVVETATGTDAGAIAPARAIQYGGALISPTNQLPVSAPPPSTAVTGTKAVTTAGTPVELGTTTGLLSGVTVKTLSGNTGKVFLKAIGSTGSFELKPGEYTFLFVSSLALFTVDSEVNGEGVCYQGS